MLKPLELRNYNFDKIFPQLKCKKKLEEKKNLFNKYGNVKWGWQMDGFVKAVVLVSNGWAVK